MLQDPKSGGDRAYGAPRVTAELNEGAAAEDRVNRKRVTWVMREYGLAGIRLRHRTATTIPDQSGRKFPDVLGRAFGIGEPSRRYVGDITYLPIVDGSNLYSNAYTGLCEQFGVNQSMEAIGSSADNALTESFDATLKRELLEGHSVFPDQATAYRSVFRRVSRYNTRRRHSVIGNISPNAYEAAFSATLVEAA